VIKKTTLEAYSRPRANGIIAVNVREGDTLLEARLTGGNHEIFLAVKSGKAIRFPEEKVRPMGRNASGVRGISLADEKDEVVGMICVEGETEDVMVVSEKGYGKRSSIEDYRVTNRGGKGVKTISITEKTGHLVAMKSVTDNDDLIIINKSGVMIRMGVSDVRVMGRATQGVRLINIKDSDAIASVTKVPATAEEDELVNPEATDNGSATEVPPTEE
jgi:DNA gyrase subunit A